MARVLRIPCYNSDKPFVLVCVNSPSGSSRPLDLTLVGTEGASPYVLSLKQSKVPSFKAKNSPCTQDEWDFILESILLGRQASEDQKEILEDVEAVASVKRNDKIDISIRKRTENITQRLGAFSLSYDETQDIELFDWCGIAVQSTSNTANELASFRSRFREQQETVSKLSAQLEDLIAAKITHETELLAKFRDLLNEKKAKIRDQQRLLATARVDPKTLVAAQVSRQNKEKTTADPSRSRKRKANDERELQEDEDDEDGSFKMTDPDDSDQQDARTPGENETETDSEDDDNTLPQAKPPGTNTRQNSGSSDVNNVSRFESRGGNSTKAQSAKDDPPRTPPRRDLSFPKKNQPEAKLAPEDEDTASEDDGL